VIILRAAGKERRLAALKSEFVANVSHELKTPLASIRMFGEMLLTGRVASEAKRTEYLQIIVRESERLTNLLDTVLDFAKVEKGKAAYTFADGDVSEAVARAVELLEHRAERQGVQFATDLQVSPAVFDARAVELAVINLVDNALKYAKGTKEIRISVIGEGAKVVVRVEDEGPGIPAKEQSRIFDRFVRGRDATDAHVRGSGIGLALVKHIAESHGGTVRIHSPRTPEGSGTCFEMSLATKPAV
jgi:two-component system phosphate regulon sensor histidine kinase PhoR